MDTTTQNIGITGSEDINYIAQGARPRRSRTVGPGAPPTGGEAQAAEASVDGGDAMQVASESTKRRRRRTRNRQKRRAAAEMETSAVIALETPQGLTPALSAETTILDLGTIVVPAGASTSETLTTVTQGQQSARLQVVSLVTTLAEPTFSAPAVPEQVTVEMLAALLETPLLNIADSGPPLPTPKTRLPTRIPRPAPRLMNPKYRNRQHLRDVSWYASWTRSQPRVPTGIAEVYRSSTIREIPPYPPYLNPGRTVLEPELQIDQATRERLRARRYRSDSYWQYRDEGDWDSEIEDEMENLLTTQEQRDEEERRERICEYIAPEFPVYETWDLAPFRHLREKPGALEAVIKKFSLDPNPPPVPPPATYTVESVEDRYLLPLDPGSSLGSDFGSEFDAIQTAILNGDDWPPRFPSPLPAEPAAGTLRYIPAGMESSDEEWG